ncbi:MAG TPA: GTPase domain-containing protein, partial [Gemmataceae bacterium]|nr:GTPase domain-containing protein [Gemmataceae bacterium]
QPPVPLHVVVVGGAGAGKSTVANLLSGAVAAEANPQAGFTRHPIAYTSANGPLNWAGHLGFLGPLQLLTVASPSSLDEDVYQVRRIPADPTSSDLLKDFIIWDCPDMTTWAASRYVSRLLEIAGLADVIVYVASDERYNDEAPTQFLQTLLKTNKPVVVCLMKMKETDAPGLVEHFQRDVLARFTHEAIACLTIPYLTAAELADPVRLAGRYRIPLLNQVAVLGNPPAAARQRVVRGASHYLVADQEQLLAAARQDVVALDDWRSLVHAGQREFDDRYRREYLASEKFRSFDEALVRLLDLLELPGVGKFVSGTLWVVRTPYRLLRGWVGKALSRPDAPGLPEEKVLDDAWNGWLNLLRKEAARRGQAHPLWPYVEQGFATTLPQLAREHFYESRRAFQMHLADEVNQTARAIYEELQKNPALLNTLRTGNFALDVAAIAGAFVLGHTPGLHDLILVPLLASLKQQIIELLGKQYVDSQREQIRARQQLLVTQYLSGPLAEWLAQWPATGGSSFERLQLALRRIPHALRQLDGAVARAISAAAGSRRAEPVLQG